MITYHPRDKEVSSFLASTETIEALEIDLVDSTMTSTTLGMTDETDHLTIVTMSAIITEIIVIMGIEIDTETTETAETEEEIGTDIENEIVIWEETEKGRDKEEITTTVGMKSDRERYLPIRAIWQVTVAVYLFRWAVRDAPGNGWLWK